MQLTHAQSKVLVLLAKRNATTSQIGEALSLSTTKRSCAYPAGRVLQSLRQKGLVLDGHPTPEGTVHRISRKGRRMVVEAA